MQLVVADLLRLAGHGTHDDASYVGDEMRSRYGDCVALYERTLSVQGVLDRAGAQKLWDEAKREVEIAVEQTRGEPGPDPATDDWQARCERDLKGLRSASR